MSNLDKMTANEQLFTELTPEQAAVVEGGAFKLYIGSIEALKTGADPVGNDEPYLVLNGKRVWTGSMSTGDPAVNFKNNLSVEFDQIATVSLYEDDGNHWYNRNDFIGSFDVNPSQLNLGTVYSKELSGGGSKYKLTYAVQVSSGPF